MENAILIMIILSFILLAGVSFLIFQTWLSMKEIKITIPKMFEDLKSYDAILKETILNSKNAHNENLSNIANSLDNKINEQYENTKKLINLLEDKIFNEQNKVKEDILANLITLINSNNDRVIEIIKNIQQNLKDNVEKLYKAITEPLDL